MKILIIGSNGMLAQALIKEFNDHDLVLWDKDDIDITDATQLQQKIPALNPDMIINCAAFTKVDDCETKQDLAMAVNGQAVGNLASLNIPLVHISTDYVFDGVNVNGYQEDSNEFGPLNVYGQSKLLGEQLLKQNTDKYYLIRTSWLYGAGGPNFVATMLHLAESKPEINVVNDQFGRPTYTVDVASQIRYIIDNNLPYGIYHAVNETKQGGITWYDFAKKIFELKNIPVKVLPQASSELNRPAKRPAHSALINTKLPPLRNYEAALKEYLYGK